YPRTTGHWADRKTTTAPFLPFRSFSDCVLPAISGKEKFSILLPTETFWAKTAAPPIKIAKQTENKALTRLISQSPFHKLLRVPTVYQTHHPFSTTCLNILRETSNIGFPAPPTVGLLLTADC